MNLFSLLLSALTGVAFGALYYGALQRPWLALLNNSTAALASIGQPQTYVFAGAAQFAVSLHMEWLFSIVDSHFGMGPHGLIPLLAFHWVCLIMAPLAMHYRFQGRPLALVVLDGFFWLGALAVQAAVKLYFYL